METIETLDVFFNGSFLGAVDVNVAATQPEILKPAEKLLPKRTVVMKKIIFVPHKSVSFIEKAHEN